MVVLEAMLDLSLRFFLPLYPFFLGGQTEMPGSSNSWKFHVTSGDYLFFEGLSEKTPSFQSPGFRGKTPRN